MTSRIATPSNCYVRTPCFRASSLLNHSKNQRPDSGRWFYKPCRTKADSQIGNDVSRNFDPHIPWYSTSWKFSHRRETDLRSLLSFAKKVSFTFVNSVFKIKISLRLCVWKRCYLNASRMSLAVSSDSCLAVGFFSLESRLACRWMLFSKMLRA